ncbi:DUF433 domain-containing protein [Candidatus Woesearchaeota archaeon]|nr:DUF433 domain-containing protein [Candidatus Woesearchaeota archaeon]
MAKADGQIVLNPAVMAGKPVVKGTRIPVDLILRLAAQGWTIKDILEEYPQLKESGVKAALQYGADIVGGEDVFPLIESTTAHA